MPDYRVGQVYRTTMPYSRHGTDAKERWFIVLGKSAWGQDPRFLFLSSTTTQLQHFATGGEKANSPFMKFQSGQFGFTKDCILCLDEIEDGLTTEGFEVFLPELKGEVTAAILRDLYNKLLSSKMVSKKVKQDIHQSLNLAGITNLRNP